MDEKAVRAFYRFLAHENLGFTELRAIRTNNEGTSKVIDRDWVDNEEDFVAFCEKHDGQANIYAGVNPRREKGGGSLQDIDFVTAIAIDVDAVYPNKKVHPATLEESKAAFARAKRVLGYVTGPEWLAEGTGVAFSGNGIHILIPIEPFAVDRIGREETQAKFEAFQRAVIAKFPKTPKAQIDNIGDLPRIIKVVGTSSVKPKTTSERQNHESKWIETASREHRNSDLVEKILALEDVADESNSDQYVTLDRDLKKVLATAPRGLRDYIAKGKPKGERSEADFALVTYLIKTGLPKHQIRSILEAIPRSKTLEASTKYFDTTHKNALKAIEQGEASSHPEAKEERRPPSEPSDFEFTHGEYRVYLLGHKKGIEIVLRRDRGVTATLAGDSDRLIGGEKRDVTAMVNSLNAELEAQNLPKVTKKLIYDAKKLIRENGIPSIKNTVTTATLPPSAVTTATTESLTPLGREYLSHIESDGTIPFDLLLDNLPEQPDAVEIDVSDIAPAHVEKKIKTTVAVRLEESDRVIEIPIGLTCRRCNYQQNILPLEAEELELRQRTENLVETIVTMTQGSETAKRACPSCAESGQDSELHPTRYLRYLYYRFTAGRTAEKDYEGFHNRERGVLFIQVTHRPLVEQHPVLDVEGIVYAVRAGRNTKRIAVVVKKAEPVSFSSLLNGDKAEPVGKYFQNITDDDIDNNIAPRIIGRKVAKKWCLLSAHTPMYIPSGPFGLANCMLAGDDTTGKTPILNDLEKKMPIVVACDENTSVPGLVGGVDIDKATGIKAITWGAMSRADGGCVLFDGFHAFRLDNLVAVREAMKQRRVKIQKIVHANRPARSRVIAAMNTAVPVEDLSSKYLALDHLGASENDVMSTIDKSRWDIIVVFSKGDVSRDDIDKAKASNRKITASITDDLWWKHFNWAWAKGVDPSNFLIEGDVKPAIRKRLAKLRKTYHNIDLVMQGPAAFEKWLGYSIASALLHERLNDDDKVPVTLEDVKYVAKAFDQYLEDIGATDADAYHVVQEETLSRYVDELAVNQKRSLFVLEKFPRSRSELAKELGMAETSVSRMMHQARERDPDTGEFYFYGVDMMGGPIPLIKLIKGKYNLTHWGRKLARKIAPQTQLPKKKPRDNAIEGNGDRSNVLDGEHNTCPEDEGGGSQGCSSDSARGNSDSSGSKNSQVGTSEVSVPSSDIDAKRAICKFCADIPRLPRDIFAEFGFPKEKGDRLIDELQSDDFLYEPKTFGGLLWDKNKGLPGGNPG